MICQCTKRGIEVSPQTSFGGEVSPKGIGKWGVKFYRGTVKGPGLGRKKENTVNNERL